MNDTLLLIAGFVGASVAVIHGVLIQKLMIDPLLESSYAQGIKLHTKKRIPVLLHFSTLCWFLGGISLIAAPFIFDQVERMVVCIVVGGFYVFGSIGNFWATLGRHPGWLLLAISVALILSSYKFT